MRITGMVTLFLGKVGLDEVLPRSVERIDGRL